MGRKEELKQEIEYHKQALNQEFSEVKRKGKKFGIAALAVGGAFFLTYTIVKAIASGKSKNYPESNYRDAALVKYSSVKPKKSGYIRKITGLLLTEVAIILAGLAKKQVKTYLSKNPRNGDNIK
jgi:hypothetical protein